MNRDGKWKEWNIASAGSVLQLVYSRIGVTARYTDLYGTFYVLVVGARSKLSKTFLLVLRHSSVGNWIAGCFDLVNVVMMLVSLSHNDISHYLASSFPP